MVSLSVTLVEQEVRPKSDYTASLELIPLQITADRPMGQHKANVCHTSLISVEIVLFRSASVQAASSGYISIYQKKKKKNPSPKGHPAATAMLLDGHCLHSSSRMR